MRRAALLAILLLLAFAGAQAQVRFNGPGASINSPGPDGSLHGVPASILSPTPIQDPNGRVFLGHGIGHQRVPFGNPHSHHRRGLVPVPIFIPAYDISPDYSVSQADPPVEPERVVDAEAVRDAYVRGAQDALARQQADSRYGQHYLDSREKAQAKPPAANDRNSAPKEDNSAPQPEAPTPATVFIFKDGHKLETQNFAISGQTLFDFSDHSLKKIKLAELDMDATRKANDDLGIDLRLP